MKYYRIISMPNSGEEYFISWIKNNFNGKVTTTFEVDSDLIINSISSFTNDSLIKSMVKTIDMSFVRDFYNVLAIEYKKDKGINGIKLAKKWSKHIYNSIEHQNEIPIILYEKWIENESYRKELRNTLGLKSVPNRKVITGFDNIDFNLFSFLNIAVIDKTVEFENNKHFQNLIDKCEPYINDAFYEYINLLEE